LLTKAGGRRRSAGGCFCNGDLSSPLQKRFASKSKVLDLIISIINLSTAIDFRASQN
jgi:hypothetical protein